ncbi:sigma-54-dependent Fis family transcriptional re gulator [Desulfonema ishimotonii]|uniref:Sigma-54-dependent Fis family transcriptional re gulator n=1 Tax=Desulfonema ishimotonii TaxID=45657 RepID=A0A401FUU4_9BACT|nr:sigma-54 dependent transcriptional regulator [Desulfonema ishimotonii]GBC60741.1 sigma-54-dependent Fis family transcriptional re gulator [Desulfonema ishimotonii]
MITYTIWIVDDEESIRDGISMALKGTYHIGGFGDAESALECIRDEPPDLILLDIGLPGMDGIEALRHIRKIHGELPVIVITAYEDVQTVISAMKLGAYDYIVKPIIMAGLRATLNNALQSVRLKKEVRALQEQYIRENMPCFVGESCSIRDVMAFISRVARSPDTPILILGETGTGKELIAHSVHYRSPNFKGPFVTVNCAAIPENLIESELFGYEKGAFSGASATGKKGLIEEAEGGTLFLDEVGDLNPDAQAKLLRFLEQGEYYRVGGTRTLKVRTRVISATNRNLEKMMETGAFRQDLYFRLSVIKVQIPSLNERKDDILPIAKQFIYEFNRKFDKSYTGLTPNAEKALIGHNWVGNIRELRNCIERGILVGEGNVVRIRDIGLEVHLKPENADTDTKKDVFFPPLTEDGIDMPGLQEKMEKFYIREALRITGGNESKAAKLLNLKPHTFRYRRGKLSS